MQRYLIDTNIWSALIRGASPSVRNKLIALDVGQVCMSPVVFGELALGYLMCEKKGDKTAKRKQALEALLNLSTPLTIDAAVASTYAKLRATLEAQGTPIGRNDTWIAAEALHHGLTVVTDNVREFERVNGLTVENWL